MKINTKDVLVIVAEELNHAARGNTRLQLATVNKAIKALVDQQQELLDQFTLRDVD